ncbi:RNA-directed DNA polymerase, eukaryota [Tanacetum coccineum]
MGSFRTKEGDVAKISTSVFITNFPESCSAKELFQSCKQYGHVVDTFIPTKRSKNGRRFGFVRFINVFNEERLGNNLCTRGNSYVHVVKGQNKSGIRESEVPPALVLNNECLLSKDLSKSLLGRVKQFVSLANLRKAVSNERFVDIKIQYMGELWVLLEFGSEDSMKLFQDNVSIRSWFSQLKQATMEFTNKGRIAWMEVEGIPLKLWTDNTFKQIATKWGELLDIDDQEEMCFHLKRLCIYTKTEKNIFEEFKIIFRGKTSWIRAKETPGWVPDFMEENDEEEQSDVDSKEGEFKVHDTGIYGGDSDVEEARETLFEKSGKKENNLDEEHKDKQEKNSEGPFNIYKLLKKKKDTTENEINSEQTMNDHKAEEANKDGHGNCVNKNSKEDVSSSVCSGHFKKSGVPHTGGSILNLMDELVKVRQVIGYKMDGCLAQKAKKDWVKELCVKNKVNFMALQETKMKNMELFSVKMCWGNFAFDYVHSDSVGNSGGILCVCDPNSFRKRNATVNDYFVMIRGVWCLTGNDLLIIAVYAPHDCRDKQMLWDYLTYEISKWKGEVVIMGDFNEVRYKSERFGSVFNVQGANVFNSFITNAGLEEVPLGGSAFTWCHKSASKMSKLDKFLVSENLIYSCPKSNAITLERYLSDPRPILLREAFFYYGPTPFRYFHYWNEMEGFNKVVEDAWREGPCDKTNAMLNMMMKLKFLKAKIRKRNKSNMLSVKNVKAKYKEELEALEAIIDRGDGNEEIINKRTEVVNNIQKFDKIYSLEMAQKAKVKWSIEWDENTSFFHGVLNKKWSILNIQGIMVDGNWIESLKAVKGEFFQPFSSRFDKPDASRATINMRYPKTLTCDQQNELDSEVSNLIRKFFKGHAINNNKASWVNWKKVLASKEKGGLGVSSLFALNRGLMFKWIWRFYTQNTLLWVRVVKAIHGDDGNVRGHIKSGAKSCWLDIVRETYALKTKGINLLDCMHVKLGNGDKTVFWEDIWIDGKTLKNRFPRNYSLESCKLITVGAKLTQSSLEYSFRRNPRGGVEQDQFNELSALVHDVSLIPMSDRWKWDLESSGDFSVASVRKIIDDKSLSDVDSKTRWIKYVPIKVNVHTWKVKTDSLPTRFNVSRRGIDIDSIMCVICDNGVETSIHLFFYCFMIRQIVRKITRWWDVPYVEVESYEDWYNWLVNLRISSMHKQMFEGIDVMRRLVVPKILCAFPVEIPEKFRDEIERKILGFLTCNASAVCFKEISIEPSKYFNLKVFTRLSDFCDHKFFLTKIEVSVIMTTGESVKEMTSKFDKLAKFEGQDFRRWQKKMHFLLTTLKVVYVLSTPSPEWSENETLETTRKRMKWENDDYICRGHILNGMSDSLFDIYQNAESAKTLWESLESKYMAEDASATKFLVSSFMNYKMVDTRPVMEQYHEMLRILGQYTQHNLMMDEAISVAVIIDKLPPSWKEFKHSLKHKKEELNLVQLGSHLRIEEELRNQELDSSPKGKNQIGSSSVNMVERDGTKNSNNNKNKRKFKSGDDKFANKKGLRILKSNKDDEVAWWVDSGATSHVCKDLRWFQVCKSIEDGSFVKMGNVATEPIKGIGRVLLTFTSGKTLCLDNVLYVPGIRKNLVSEIVLNKCGYKQVLESDKYILSRHGSFVGFGYVCNGMIRLNLNYPLFNASACMITSSHSNSLSKSELWHARLGHVHYKRMRDMSKMSLIPAFDMTHESCKTCMLTKITRQPFKGVNRESKVLDLIHSDLCDFHANPSLGHNKYVITFIDDASRYCYVYLLHAKHEALDKFKIYKQEVELQRQDLIKVLRTDRGGEYYDPVYFQSTGIIHQTTAPYTPQQNGVAERKNRTLKEMVNSMLSYSGLSEGFWGEAMLTACYILNRTPNKNSKQTPYEIWTKKVPNLTYLRVWGCRAVVRLTEPKMKNLGEKGTRDKTLSQREYCFIIEEDPRTLSEAMASRDVAFWKEAIQSEIDSIMHNNTWELTDLPSGCKALGCKWILKRKMKVDGSIDKYKARLVIQGFRQKEGIDFFDTYAPVARISTIRLLLALAAIHDLVIHQMDVKTAFLNGDLDEEIYMKQPEGFVMPGHESKVCKLKKSLYGLKQAPKQWHQKFDDVVLSNGFSLNQVTKYQVNKTKEFLSSNFDMKDLGEAEASSDWINNMEDPPSTSGGFSFLEGGAFLGLKEKRSHVLQAQPWSLNLWPWLQLVMKLSG